MTMPITLSSNRDPRLKAFMDEYIANTEAHPFNRQQRIMWPVVLEISTFDGTIHLGDITTVDQHRQGHATRVLTWLKSLADKHGVAITGIAKAYNKRDKNVINKASQLVAWYKKHGFDISRGSAGDGYPIRYNPKLPESYTYIDFLRGRIAGKV